jgi:hypothetical protein
MQPSLEVDASVFGFVMIPSGVPIQVSGLDLQDLPVACPEWIKRDFSDVFSAKNLPSLPPRREGVDMPIELLPGKLPPFGPIYSLSQQEESTLKAYIEDALKSNIIRESRSPAGSPVMFVTKPDASLRLCVDYRGLNAITRTNRAALPIIKDMLKRTVGCRIFSKVDLKSAFNLIRIAEGQEYLTAFRTKYGHYEYLVMPFGLKNAPGHFQSFMNHIFHDLIDAGLLVYIDDLLIYAITQAEHDRILAEVLKRIRKFNLQVNPKKCEFGVPEVEFLGHLVSAAGLKMCPSKIKSIQEWDIPSTVKEIQSFLGLANYYRDFIRDFARLSQPLINLTKRGVPFNFDHRCLQAFNDLKRSFREEVILSQPDQTKQFFLECDASDFAIGGVLQQMDDRVGKLRPVGFFSRKLQPAEINYEIYDKELLAIVDCLLHWRYLCIGTTEPVIIHSDHRNLQWFMTSRRLNRRQARWSILLADFNFQLEIRPGTKQMVADPLSRQAKYRLKPGDPEVDVNMQVVLPPHKFVSPTITCHNLHLRATTPDISEEGEEDHVSNHSDSEEMDDTVWEVAWEAEYLTGSSPDPVWFQHLLTDMIRGYLPMVLAPKLTRYIIQQKKWFTIKDDRLHRVVQRGNHTFTVPYVPISARDQILKNYHLTLGHLGPSSMISVMEIRHYWPSMEKDIKEYVSQCTQCQLQAATEIPRHPLHPHEPVGLPFIKWGIDFVQDLPETTDGNRHIITAIDYASKYTIAKAVQNRNASTVARFIYESITCTFGAPVEIVSDRASAFMDEVLQGYLRLLEIHHLPTTPYRPRSNGAVERMHRTLNGILTKLCAGERHKWDIFLPQACLAINSRVHEATGYSPFYLVHGCLPRLPGDELPNLPPHSYSVLDSSDAAILTAKELASLGQARAAALQRLKTQAIRMKERYDVQVGVEDHQFHVGDIVKLKHHDRLKFQFTWTGPYYIVDKGPNDSYYLMKPNGQRIDNTVSHDHLAPFSVKDPEYYYAGGDAGLEDL